MTNVLALLSHFPDDVLEHLDDEQLAILLLTPEQQRQHYILRHEQQRENLE